MSFRDNWSLAAKPRTDCPLCGVEVKRGQQCSTHIRADHNRLRRQIDTHRTIRLVCELVDQARK